MASQRSTAILVIGVLSSVTTVGAGDANQPPSSDSLPRRVLDGAALPTLSLAWLDLAGVPDAAAAIAKEEAVSLIRSMGLEPCWRRVRASEAAREGEIRVVVVNRLLVDADKQLSILGATAPERRPFPVIWVYLASVRGWLCRPPRSPNAALSVRERRDLGLAVGRVVAHEVVHAVAPAVAHGRGLMSGTLSRRALTRPRISFEPDVALAVWASLRGGRQDRWTPDHRRTRARSTR